MLFRASCLALATLLATACAPAATPLEPKAPPREGPAKRTVLVQMHRIGDPGGRLDVELLRPGAWVDARALRVGQDFDFDASEPSLAGTMRIDALRDVELGPESLQGDDRARRVTGRFITQGAKTYRLTLVGGHDEVRATGNHPLFSLDRNGWVDVAELKPGERLRTHGGEAVVESVSPRDGAETVYNLEVQGKHVYFAGERGLLAHNGCGPDVSRGEWPSLVEQRKGEFAATDETPVVRYEHIGKPNAKATDHEEVLVSFGNGDHAVVHRLGSFDAIIMGADPGRARRVYSRTIREGAPKGLTLGGLKARAELVGSELGPYRWPEGNCQAYAGALCARIDPPTPPRRRFRFPRLRNKAD